MLANLRAPLLGRARWARDLGSAGRAARALGSLPAIDLRTPARLYPHARRLARRVILHVGPTNSGKSYAALQAFQAARTAWYAAPLRMLAREVYDRTVGAGLACNLVTGDEVIGAPDVGHHSCTVEMISTGAEIDVAVIDEIQMINDPARGWAWTRALLGVQAAEVHLCGDASSEAIVAQLVAQAGDRLEVRRYERLAPLELDARPLQSATLLAALEPGDCVVCFSKRKVKALRDQIVRQRGLPCAVVYGSLPPEVRAEQAALFNSGQVPFLVSTDAVGMGLNLAIKRVIFTAVRKFNGIAMHPLSVSEIKQIAGRAGRFRVPGSAAPAEAGLVNCFTKDKPAVKRALAAPSPGIRRATCDVPNDTIQAAAIDSRLPFSYVLRKAISSAQLGPAFQAPEVDSAVFAARLYDEVYGLTFEDKLTLANAPVAQTPECVNAFKKMCRVVGHGQTKNVLEVLPELGRLGAPALEALALEDMHKALTLFLWLSYRFPCNFLDRQGAVDLKGLCEQRLLEMLASRRRLQVARRPVGGRGGGARRPVARELA